MPRFGLAIFTLLLALVCMPVQSAGRILVLNGYVDGLPFPWRLKSELRAQLESDVPGIAIHTQSLDLYRPQPDNYKTLLVNLIRHTYKDQVDLIIALDPLAFEFYKERLKPDFADIPVIFSNDRGKNPELADLEYSLEIRPDLSETLRIAKHHYPELKRLFILGDSYNQSLAQSALADQLVDIELIPLGHLSLDQMREEIAGLGKGDLLLFQLLFADGEGTPMIPPIRYLKEFAELNPMPTLCMYANFIAQGCLGGSVSSPKTQASAIIDAIQTLTPEILALDDSVAPTSKRPEQSVIQRFASESVVDYSKLKSFNLKTDRLPDVIYLNEPQPFYEGYARELAFAVVLTLLLLAAVSLYLLTVSRQRRLLHRFVTLTDKAPSGIFWTDNNGLRWHHNQRAKAWAEELKMTVDQFRQAALHHLENSQRSHEEFRLSTDDQERFFRVGVSKQYDQPEMLLLEDTTSLRRYQARLEEQANHDELTQLPNRRALQTALEQWCIQAERQGTPFALLMIDLDGFKEINDEFGHQAGDDLLKQVADRLKSRCRQNDLVGRLGGDEFLLLAENLTLHKEASNFANSVLQLLSKPYTDQSDTSERELNVSASIGVALCPAHSTDASTLQIYADRAMYRVKDAGKSGVQIYTESA